VKIVLRKQQEVNFEQGNLKGKFICAIPKASDYVAFWAEYRNIEGSEAEKAKKTTKLVISTFLEFVKGVVFDAVTEFTTEEGETLKPLSAMEEFYSFVIYQKGMEFLNPGFGGEKADPLEKSSIDS
jgi:hypothetical protein